MIPQSREEPHRSRKGDVRHFCTASYRSHTVGVGVSAHPQMAGRDAGRHHTKVDLGLPTHRILLATYLPFSVILSNVIQLKENLLRGDRHGNVWSH